jgi:hypothetical protein
MSVVKTLDYRIQMNDYLLLMMEQDVDYVLMLVYTMKYDLIAKNKRILKNQYLFEMKINLQLVMDSFYVVDIVEYMN